ncbi:hypothetical protein HDV02_000727 [Globomyces sp. JEL0801]|nr:hypothetical protein HDV02_000727 [Globomyces sp. JEL0801]
MKKLDLKNQDLEEISFGNLIQVRDSLGSKSFNSIYNSKVSKKKNQITTNDVEEEEEEEKETPKKKKVFKRDDKNMPQEITSKKPVTRKRTIIESNNNYEESEVEQLKKVIATEKDVEKKANLKSQLTKLTSKLNARKLKEKRMEMEKGWKKKELELVKQGKKPFYMKNSEKKKLELVEKFKSIGKGVSMEKFLEKRRKKNASREHRKIPSTRRRYLATETLRNPNFVKIVEVGPRDGLQNEKAALSTNLKLQLINKLINSGLSVVEAAAFVSPKWVPQMSDASDVCSALPSSTGVSFPVLCPNMQGLKAAMKVGVKEIAVFGAASESFSKKNINCTIEESLQRFEPVIKTALENNIKVRGYVSTVVGCPYEGNIDPKKVAFVSDTLYNMGTPVKFSNMIDAVSATVPLEALAVHCHDTYGQAIGNIVVSLQKGIRVVDSSVAGLGGCPYAKGASGNVSTEDVVYLLHGMGYETGVDLEAIVKTGHWISQELHRNYMSKAGTAIAGALHL